METLSRHTYKMLNDGVMTDVTFVVQGTEIKGHSDIVSSHGGPLRDRLKTKPEKMEIDDISPRTFRTLLEYIYTDNCTVNVSNVFELMYAARKLELPNLVHRCANVIKQTFSAGNIAEHTAQALDFDIKEYLLVCKEYFSTNTKKIIEMQEFLKISSIVLETFCSNDEINCSELELFSACVKWAKHQCGQQNREATPDNLRTVMGEALSKIRFPCMPLDQVVPTGILSFEEIGEITVGQQNKTQKSRYSDVNRHITWNFTRFPEIPVLDSLSTRMFDMLNNNIMTDVTFVIEGVEIKAHRNVAGSCGGPLRDLLETKAERIELQDIAVHTFRTILEYLYTDRCVVGPSNALGLLHAARKLHLKNLEIVCADEVKAKLSATNVWEFAKQALHFDLNEYFCACTEYFQNNTLQVIAAQEFLGISREVLSTLCGSERINCSEVELFSACIKWASHQCQQQSMEASPENLRAVMGDALSKIRFPCILMADFQEHVVPVEVLNFQEVGEVVAGWYLPNIKSRFPNVDRQFVQITIEGYTATTIKAVEDSTFKKHDGMGMYPWMEPPSKKKVVHYYKSSFHVLLSTKISQLKSMKIFDGGKQQHPPDKFTLRNGSTELADDVTLASLCTHGQHLTRQFGSFTFMVKNIRTQMIHPLTVEIKHVKDIHYNMLKHSIRELSGSNVSIIDFPNVHPGATIAVRYY